MVFVVSGQRMPLETRGNSCQVLNNPFLLSLWYSQVDLVCVELENSSGLTW